MFFILALKKWYKENKRDLPWRKTNDPYKIWISEIILQQTRVNQGYAYYLNFIKKFPDIKTLAMASEDSVLQAWEGLGYYTRAHNLHFSAKTIYFNLNNQFPKSYQEIIKLKGIGKYTAAAISSISFNEKVPAIDGNAFRVYSRIFNSSLDISKNNTFKYFFNLIKPNMPENPGDFNQAVMDLGSQICKPVSPVCEICPIQNYCLAFMNNNQENLPINKLKVIIRDQTIHYAYFYSSDSFLAIKRDNKGIWKGLYEFLLFKKNYLDYPLVQNQIFMHKLSHRNLTIKISEIYLSSTKLEQIAVQEGALIVSKHTANNYAFPKPLKIFLH